MKEKIMMALGLLVFLVLLGGVSLRGGQEQEDGDEKEPVVLTFLETINDADCTVITQGNTTIMIDTGEEADAPNILAYLKEKKINKLQYLIISHPDADHMGGAKTILEQMPVERIIKPYYAGDKQGWDELKAVVPTHTYKVKIAGMELLFYPPLEKRYRESNNYSMAVLLRHGKVTALFPGDAVKKRTEELLKTDWPDITIYKAAHHGRQNQHSTELIERIKPEYMIVTSNQADDEVKKACEAQGGDILYTANGKQQFCSNGISVIQQHN